MQQLELSPHRKKLLDLKVKSFDEFLCGFCLFFMCLHECALGAPVSSHTCYMLHVRLFSEFKLLLGVFVRIEFMTVCLC